MKRCEYVFVRLGQGAKGPNFDFGILEEGSSVGMVKEWIVDVVEVAAVRRLSMKCGRDMGYWCGMDDVLDHVMMTWETTWRVLYTLRSIE